MKKPIYFTITIIASSLLMNGCQKAPISQVELESDNFDDISSQFDKGEEVKLSRRQIASSTQKQRGIVSANAVNGSSGTRYSNYGYSPAMNTLLGFADYMHWKDPSFINFTKIMVGKNVFVPTPLSQPALYCGKWDFKITSTQIQKLLIGIPNDGVNQAIEADSKTVHLKWKSTDSKLFTGIIIGLKSPAVDEGCLDPIPEDLFLDNYDPFSVIYKNYIRRNSNYTNWYGTNDPYSNGYNGDLNGYYYSYPPPLCAPRHTPLTLRVTGTVSNCDGSDSQNIDINLDSLVNDGSGYAPRKVQTFGAGNKHRFLARSVNYNGGDWYLPQQSNWIYPDYQNSCFDIKTRIDAARLAASQCTADTQCAPDYAITEQCKPSFVKNINSDVLPLIQLEDYSQRYCPQPTIAVVCTAQAFTSTACVQSRCSWR